MTMERLLSVLLLGIIAYGCTVILWPFLSALAWAAILAFSTWPLHRRLRYRYGPVAAAILMVLLSALTIVVPLIILTTAGMEDVPPTIARLDDFLQHVATSSPPPTQLVHLPIIGPYLANLWDKIAHGMDTLTEVIRPHAGRIARIALHFLLRLASSLAELAVALFIAFFLWLNGDALGKALTAIIIRVAGPYGAARLINVTGRTIRGTVYGILGTAIIQGVLTGIGLMIAGVPSPVLLAGLTAFVAVFPIGAPLVWLPAALWLAMTHHLSQGLFLAVYGTFVISAADHLIRPAFISRGARLPYVLAVLGVLGGVISFGGVGIFLGPALLALGYSLVSEFATEPTSFPNLPSDPET